jgi:hypothetical protein
LIVAHGDERMTTKIEIAGLALARFAGCNKIAKFTLTQIKAVKIDTIFSRKAPSCKQS